MFPIIVCQSRLKGAAMQIPLDDIGGSERPLRQIGEEEFGDDVRTRDTDGTLLLVGWMGGHHHAAEHALGSQRHLWAVVEAAHHLAFRALLVLIWWQVQTRLDERMIEQRVLFASCHESEVSQVGEHGSRAIWSVEPKPGALLRELVRREIATNGREGLTPFLPVEPVASVAK